MSGTLIPCCRNCRNRASHFGLSVVSTPRPPVLITFLGWKEKHTILAERSADLLPLPVDGYFAADGAGCVFDDAKIVPSCDLHHRFHVRTACPSGVRTGSRACGGYRSLYGWKESML